MRKLGEMKQFTQVHITSLGLRPVLLMMRLTASPLVSGSTWAAVGAHPLSWAQSASAGWSLEICGVSGWRMWALCHVSWLIWKPEGELNPHWDAHAHSTLVWASLVCGGDRGCSTHFPSPTLLVTTSPCPGPNPAGSLYFGFSVDLGEPETSEGWRACSVP